MESKSKSGKAFEFEKQFIYDPARFGNFVLHQMGDICCEPGYSCVPHNQWCYEITCVISGEGISTVNGREFEIKTGDVILTPLNVDHLMTATTRLRYLFIGFDIVADTKNEDLMRLSSFFRAAPLDTVSMTNEIREAFYDCLNEHYSSQPCYKTMVETSIARLIVNVYRAFNGTRRVRYRVDDKINYVALPLYSALLYIDSDPTRVSDIATLAKELGYSTCYLSHLFRKGTGQTLQQYICSKKIERAISLITEKKMSITDVASELAYSSPQAFSKAFKRVMGTSPKEYAAMQIKQTGTEKAE